MLDIDRHVREAREHLTDAEHWGYSPDPWAVVIVDLYERVLEADMALVESRGSFKASRKHG